MRLDDIFVTRSDFVGVEDIKEHLKMCFVTKNLGQLRYFLGIEVARGK